MTYFSVVIPYVAWMLVYILLGFVAVKAGWSETAHGRSISGILVYICAPAMFFRAFQRLTYSPEDSLLEVPSLSIPPSRVNSR